MRIPTTGWTANRRRQHSRVQMLTYVVALCLIAAVCVVFGLRPAGAQQQEREPILTTGHGGFFGPDGRQIPVTRGFVERAQAWYRNRLLSELSAVKRREFADYERSLFAGLDMDPQERLIVRHQALEWLLANIQSVDLKRRTTAKLRALRYAMKWKLPEQAELKVVDRREPFVPRPEVTRRLEALRPTGIKHHPVTGTTNSGQAYIDECIAAGVPIPPTINQMDSAGLTGWKSHGFIPEANQFIVETPAELRSFRSTAPEGMCYSLPRYTDTSLSTIMLDGVICMGKVSSKVCFWDNQWTNAAGVVETFEFPARTEIPIGVPATAGGKYQAGGKEIESGDLCTDCHAGENPYIIHPKSNLEAPTPSPTPSPTPTPVVWETLSRAPESLPSIPVNRYDPLVAAWWPQNQYSQAFSTVPGACRSCHIKTPAGPGRFPHLSNELSGYCSTVLTKAITRTMPPHAPGSAAVAANAFRDAWCNAAPDLSVADAGDPHLTTVNNVRYDFQSAGEFVMLRADEEFEVQVRKAPIATTFNPGADPHNGLSTCPSLNTAVAARVGNRRITYQPNLSGVPDPSGLQLRVDGVLTTLGPGGIDLGNGGRIISVPAPRGGGLQVNFPNGAIMYVIPNFWDDQGYWFMNVDVTKTRAVEGVLGFIKPGD